jgi:SAM-dependent methyltransferase
MSGANSYTFRIDESEVERFREMAVNAFRHEHELWDEAGIGAGATVVDLGCGPGAVLKLLAERTEPTGQIIGVDADPEACLAAAAVATTVAGRARVVQADIARSGIEHGSADVVVMRNVLVHNGRRASQLLAAAAALLRPGGYLLSAEPDVEGIQFGAAADAEQDHERSWSAMMRADGNDPALGSGDRLPALLKAHGWRVRRTLTWTDRLQVAQSPAWAAADTIVQRGFATANQVAYWQQARDRRLATGQLHCVLTMTTALAAHPRAMRPT